MRILLLMAALVFAACGPTRDIICETKCGTQMVALPPDYFYPADDAHWSCPELQRAEDTLLPLVVGKYPKACDKLKVQIAFQPSAAWEFWGTEVAGVTYCPLGVVELGNLDMRISAYPHEMLHVLQGCFSPPPLDPDRDIAHADWDRNGFQGIINQWHDNVWEELE